MLTKLHAGTRLMFDIISVPSGAPDTLGSVGSKRKFWYTRRVRDDRDVSSREEDWLFKAARQNTGEDWAEKVAAELCGLLRLPCATYELATWTEEKKGQSTTWNGVVTRRMEANQERLTLGNEVLADHVNRYPAVEGDRFYKNPHYTLDLTLEVLGSEVLNIGLPRRWPMPEAVTSVPEAFLGFLLIDAWIGNTDRHDNNWGLIERSTSEGTVRTLAPTFDHASSLGRELTDARRREALTTNDKNRTVQAYVDRCRSAFVDAEESEETIHPTEAFRRGAEQYPKAAATWMRRLETIPQTDVKAIFERIPEARISDISIKFALRQLSINRNDLLDLNI